jgi:hypothetical protein
MKTTNWTAVVPTFGTNFAEIVDKTENSKILSQINKVRGYAQLQQTLNKPLDE